MSERENAVKTSHNTSRQPYQEDVERSPFRTVHPPEAPIVSGADSIRAVVDNVAHNIDEVKIAIEKNMAEAVKLQRRLDYLLKLNAIAEDYSNGK